MADLPSRADLVRAGRGAALAVTDGPVPASEFDRDGANANLLLNMASLMGEEVVQAVARAMRDLFVDTAVAQGLDKLGFDRYGLVRLAAQRAEGTARFSRPTTAGGAGTIPAGTRVSTVDGVQFEATQPASLSSVGLSVDVPVRSIISGVAANAPAGAVTQIVDPPFDQTITVTNPEPMAGGSDPEKDPAFARRIKLFLPTLRRGIKAAIEFAAISTPGVAEARAIEVLNPDGVPATIVELFVLDASGSANSDLVQEVRDNLLEFRALGISVVVQGGTIVQQDIELSLEFSAGIDTLAVAAKVKATVAAVVNDIDIGEKLPVALIVAAAKSVAGVTNVAVIQPVGDVVPATSEAIRTSEALVTID